MSILNLGVGYDTPPYSYGNIQYSKLLTSIFEDVPLWQNLMASINTIYDGVVHYPMDQFYTRRSWKSSTDINLKNIATSGYTVNFSNLGSSGNPNYNEPEVVAKLAKNLGVFIKTKGASASFLSFIGYVENTQFTFIPLWANSLSNTPSDLVSDPGLPVWAGGTYFPTPYFDVEYNPQDYPNLNLDTFIQLLQPIIPIHLVLRAFANYEIFTATEYAVAVFEESSEIITTATYQG
jgi:hypothetical protein